MTDSSRPDAAPGGAALTDIRWGFLGAGGIAATMADAIARTEGARVMAVAARDADRSRRFADQHGIERSYGDYAQLCADPDVDVVYVNTTHPFHREHALLAIGAGKHVLVEKAFTLNADQAREVFDAAQAAGVFAMEALWTRTLPLVREIARLVAAGEIGEVRRVASEVSVAFAYDPGHRLFDLANGGGALLDLGCYAVTLPHLLLGPPDTLDITGSLAPSGAEDTVAMQWAYATGATAHVYVTSRAAGPNRATISGTGGWIDIDGPVIRPVRATVHTKADNQTRTIELPFERFVDEVTEVGRCIRGGELQSPLVPHAATVEVMSILDAARARLGVRFPQEG